MLDITLTVTYFAFLLGFGLLIANLSKKISIPDVFFLLLFGLFVGPTIFKNPFITQYLNITLVNTDLMGIVPDFLRTLALILVVFTGAFNLSFREFKKFSNTAIKLAFLGVIFNTVVLGFVAHLIFGLDLICSFLLSAILSGTGTSIIYSFSNTIKGFKKSLTILNIESIFNSPLSIILPVLFLNLILVFPGTTLQPLNYLSQFWQMIAAGVGTGLILGFAFSKLLKNILKEYTSLLLFAIALITYALAENVGGSGILAVAVAGLIIGNLPFAKKEEFHYFEDQLTEVLRISVFTLLGAQIFFTLDFEQFLLTLLFFAAIFFFRPIFTIPLLGKKLRNKIGKKEILMLSFVAPRGLAAAAIAPIAYAVILPIYGSMIAVSILNIIFLIILLSVFFSSVVAYMLKENNIAEENEMKKEEKEVLKKEIKAKKFKKRFFLKFRKFIKFRKKKK